MLMAAQDSNDTRSVATVTGDDGAMREWAEQLVARARVEGVELTGDDGLLTAMVRQVLQTGLEVKVDLPRPGQLVGRESLELRSGHQVELRGQPRLPQRVCLLRRHQ